jgi:hypothetical protein
MVIPYGCFGGKWNQSRPHVRETIYFGFLQRKLIGEILLKKILGTCKSIIIELLKYQRGLRDAATLYGIRGVLIICVHAKINLHYVDTIKTN